MLQRLLTAALAAALSTPVLAAGPMQKNQAPGYYRLMVGDFEVTALSDGTVDLPMDQLLQAKPGVALKALQQAYLGTPVETSVNGYLVNTGAKLVLIDTGAAGVFGPTLGKLAANLKAAGYQAEQIDEVYMTHVHPDHVSGITQDGKAVFPNAVVRISQADADYWLNPANAAKAPEGHKSFFPAAVAAFKPYQDAGRLKPFSGDLELVSGIRAMATPGHTPGHTIYMVESKGQKLAVWGDIMHVASVQFPDPTVTITFDSDSKSAMPQRQKVFADAAKQGYLVALAHVSFPGIGHLRAHGKGYDWLPVNYSTKF